MNILLIIVALGLLSSGALASHRPSSRPRSRSAAHVCGVVLLVMLGSFSILGFLASFELSGLAGHLPWQAYALLGGAAVIGVSRFAMKPDSKRSR